MGVACGVRRRFRIVSLAREHGTWADGPRAVQVIGIRVVAVGQPSGHFIEDVGHAPPQFAAWLNARVAVPARPSLVALAKTVARAPAHHSGDQWLSGVTQSCDKLTRRGRSSPRTASQV